jgi:D-proline reductase (dithiol) PrdB
VVYLIPSMATIGDLSLPIRAFLWAYRWRRVDPVPVARLRRPLREARVAVVSTAGLVPPDQPLFDPAVRGGDPSFRVIPVETDLRALVDAHRSETYDHAGIAADANLALPFDRLRELAAAGEIGAVAPHHLSFMGSITAPGRLVRDTAPAAAEVLVRDEVDVALLVPV